MKTLKDFLTVGTILPALMMSSAGMAAPAPVTATIGGVRTGNVLVAQAAPSEDELRRRQGGGGAPAAPRPAAPVQSRPEAPRPPAPPRVEAPRPPAPVEKRVAPPAPVEKRVAPPAPVEKHVAPPAPIEKHVAPPAPVEKRVAPPAPIEKHVAPPAPVQRDTAPAVTRPPAAPSFGEKPKAPAPSRDTAPAVTPAPVAPKPTTPVPHPGIEAPKGPTTTAPKVPTAPTAPVAPSTAPTTAPMAPGAGGTHPGGPVTPPAVGTPPTAPHGAGAPVPPQGGQRPPSVPGAERPNPTPGAERPNPTPGAERPNPTPGVPGQNPIPGAERPMPPQGDARPLPPQNGGRPGGPGVGVGTAVGAAAVGVAVGVVGGMILGGGDARGLDDVQRQRRETVRDGVTIYSEPGRVIERDGGTLYMRHDETERFQGGAGEVSTERRGNETVQTWRRPDGVRIVTVTDPDGRLIRRIRRWPDGRDEVLIDDSRRPRSDRWADQVVVLPPPPTRQRWYVESDHADEGEIYDALAAEPLAPLPRRYSLDEVRVSRDVRAYMSAVDVDTITFATGSWTVEPSQAARLGVIARSITRLLQASPDEIFLIEGHTDAIGNDIDNLSLSDRRAGSVASILSRDFGVPPENLTTQGYGRQVLKEATDGASRINRRVTVRRITPLLDKTATP